MLSNRKFLFKEIRGMLSHAITRFYQCFIEICWFNKHTRSVMKKQTSITGQPWYGMYTILSPVDYIIQRKKKG